MKILKRLLSRKELNSLINIVFYGSRSFSQYGEDKIINGMLSTYKLHVSNYIDIGAHHPFKMSNTAFFYNNGIHGINIEPDPILFKKFGRYRKKDINLNIGIHQITGEIKFYQFEMSEYNTFSKEVATKTEKSGIKMVNEFNVKVETYNNVVREKLYGIPPDILFLDAEGLDEIIIKSIDYEHFSPKIICIETYPFGAKKNYEIINFLINKDYTVHADTFVNTIFIKSIYVGSVL